MMCVARTFSVLALLVASPALGEVCLAYTKSDVPNFVPDCAIESAFLSAFGGFKKPRPVLERRPHNISNGEDGNPVFMFNYDVTFVDNPFFRSLGRSDDDFDEFKQRFTGELRSEVCRRTTWLNDAKKGPRSMEFRFKLQLNTANDTNQPSGFPKDLRLSYNNCEAP